MMSLKNRESFIRHALIAVPFILLFAIFKKPVFWLLELVRLAIYIEVVQCVMYVRTRFKVASHENLLMEIWRYLKKKGIDACVDIFAPLATYTLCVSIITFIVWLVV